MATVEAIVAHVQGFFDGHEIEVIPYDRGAGRRKAVRDLRIVVVAPGA